MKFDKFCWNGYNYYVLIYVYAKMVEKHRPTESFRETRESLNSRSDIDDLKKQIVLPKIREIVEDAMFLNPLLSFWSAVNLSNKQDQIVDYIIDWKLWSGKTPQLEKDIEELSHHPMAWKLRYLLDNPWNPLEVTLSEIENKEKNIRENNAKNLTDLQKQSEQLNNKEEPSLIVKWWEWLTDKIKWIWANFVNFADVPEKLWSVFWDMLAKAEEYIWRPYKSGSLDCSWFLSKIFSIWQWKQNMDRWVAKDFADRYKKVNRSEVRCGDIIYQAKPAHVELIVSKPYVENGITYVMTIGSSTDKDNVDPMYDANWKPIRGKTWVWYRRRQIYPYPRHAYEFHRPPYEQWSKNRT